MRAFSSNFRNVAAAIALAMAASILAPLAGLVGERAHAASVDFSGEYLNFDASTMQVLTGDTTSPRAGDVYLYPNAGVIQGVSVDVSVQVLDLATRSGTVNWTYQSLGWVWDRAENNQFFGQRILGQDQPELILLEMTRATLTLRFSFWETGSVAYSNGVTGIPVELRNIQVNTYDLDDGQWAAFSGFQTYEVNSDSPLAVVTTSPSSLVKFESDPNSNYSGDTSFREGRARVTFDQATTLDVSLYAPSSALYALQFGAGISWPSPRSFSNPGNAAPESTSTSKYVVSGITASMVVADFGQYSDADSNPLKDIKFESSDLVGLSYFNGASTVSVTAGSTVSADAIREGRLNYLLNGSSPATLSFRVGDGLAYSAVAYSISLLVAQQTQTITFPPQIAPQSPGAGAFSSSATADSQLPVTLTSNTPNVCTIHANGTDIVPQITSQRSVCSVTATQAGNSTYASATPVTRLFYFSNQVITFPQPSAQTFVLNNAVSSSATADSGLPVTLTSLTPAICSVSSLDIVTLDTGSCTVRAEQLGGVSSSNNVTYLAAFPVLRTFQITSGVATPLLTMPTQVLDQHRATSLMQLTSPWVQVL